MERKQLYMIREEENGPEWLGTEEDAEYAEYSRKTNKASEITVEAMAGMLDQSAESCNAHDFVGCHRGLAALLSKHLPRHRITKIFRDLVDMEGLHGMVGVCGSGDLEATEAYLGVKLDGSEWKLSD